MLASGGVITRDNARALGMADRTISRRVASGELVAVGRGILALPGVLMDELSLLGAASSALGAVVSHESAARLFGVSGLIPDRITVAVPIRKTNRFRNVMVHQLTDLEPSHILFKAGLPITVPARIPVDMASVLRPTQLADVTDQLVRWKHTTYAGIYEMYRSLTRSGKPGMVNLGKVLSPRVGGTFTSDSTLETLLYQLIADSGLPLPETQYRPRWLRHQNGRVDFVYREHRLVIEGDSVKHHGTPEHFQKDRERDNAAQLAGWRILRFTWHDITKRPEYVIATIRSALSAPIS